MAKRTGKRAKINRIQEQQTMVFDATNYVIFLVAIILILGGFLGMYIENEFEGWFSLYVSPLMIVGGFVLVAIGILKKPAESSKTDAAS